MSSGISGLGHIVQVNKQMRPDVSDAFARRVGLSYFTNLPDSDIQKFLSKVPAIARCKLRSLRLLIFLKPNESFSTTPTGLKINRKAFPTLSKIVFAVAFRCANEDCVLYRMNKLWDLIRVFDGNVHSVVTCYIPGREVQNFVHEAKVREREVRLRCTDCSVDFEIYEFDDEEAWTPINILQNERRTQSVPMSDAANMDVGSSIRIGEYRVMCYDCGRTV